jgi:acyl carrier protein
VSARPPVVADEGLDDAVRGMISEVLMVPRDQIRPDSALVADLGAESIDFLDLVFRIEDLAGHRIPTTAWANFIRERLPGATLSSAITMAIVVEFAAHERDRDRAGPTRG